jgi:8-oxo-dGTP pyrophosphatase MutT (NUDIX family)
MCYLCHTLGKNPTAPKHESLNCRDPTNTHSRFYGTPSAHSQGSQHRSALKKVDRVHIGPGSVAGYMYSRNALYMVQEKSGNWGVLAGGVRRGEKPFVGLLREFTEEIGPVQMPRLHGLGKFIFVHTDKSTTAIYSGSVGEDQLPSAQTFRPNREIRAVQWVPFSEVYQMVNGRHPTKTMRHCAINSTRAWLTQMGI